ncbi:MAG: S-adenosylmethionine:tRNA ribosyltransferase-isomerase [Chitinophagaceae bacterium]
MHPKALRIEDFTYDLPEDRIAQFPLEDRDASRLLVYRNGALSEDIYRNIVAYIEPGTMVVFNQTRVVHVRLLFYKESGARIEVFCLEPDSRYADIYTALSQNGYVYWRCLIGGAAKWKDGQELSLYNEAAGVRLSALLIGRGEGYFTVKLSWTPESISFAEVLQLFGKVPLPPYMQREVKDDDKERYQTIYAKEEGSVAAPTAGLHFTEGIFRSFDEKQITREYITLHVGAGTFKQVKTEHIGDHEMHAEWIEIDAVFVEKLIAAPGRAAVGTTSLRCLESLYWIGVKLLHHIPVNWNANAVEQWDAYTLPQEVSVTDAMKALLAYLRASCPDGRLSTRTQILIAPGYRVRVVKQLVTNFHQPGSTLLLLIAALIGDDWKEIYKYALEHQFRFLSYGDGCLINIAGT